MLIELYRRLINWLHYEGQYSNTGHPIYVHKVAGWNKFRVGTKFGWTSTHSICYDHWPNYVHMFKRIVRW